jgi:peptidoglycan hydrolase FlgJ
METAPILPQPHPGPTRQEQMMAKAEELEASFLAEMLSHSGLGEMTGPFGGGSGEAQFSSFLRSEQAKLMVERGGVGLAELIFNSMVKADHVDPA